MADSIGRQILDAIRDRLVLINGAGYYHNDLSGTGQVIIGQAANVGLMAASGAAVALVAPQQTASTTGPVLNRFTRAYEFVIVACTPTDGGTENAALKAMDLQDDLMYVLESSRDLGLSSAGVRDMLIQGTAYDGFDIDLPGWSICELTIRVTADTQRGA